jgi:hypothetical protein
MKKSEWKQLLAKDLKINFKTTLHEPELEL